MLNEIPITKTFLAYVVVKKCVVDFGMGKGVIQRAQITMADEHGSGFDGPEFAVEMCQQLDNIRDECVEVLVAEKRPGPLVWNESPKEGE